MTCKYLFTICLRTYYNIFSHRKFSCLCSKIYCILNYIVSACCVLSRKTFTSRTLNINKFINRESLHKFDNYMAKKEECHKYIFLIKKLIITAVKDYGKIHSVLFWVSVSQSLMYRTLVCKDSNIKNALCR